MNEIDVSKAGRPSCADTTGCPRSVANNTFAPSKFSDDIVSLVTKVYGGITAVRSSSLLCRSSFMEAMFLVTVDDDHVDDSIH